MSDEGDAREALKREAERLKQQREQAAQSAVSAEQALKARLEGLAKTYSERRFWSSVTRWTGPLLFTSVGTAALFWGISVDFEEEKNPSRVPYGLIWTSLAFGLVVLIRYIVYGPWRYHRWLSALPFRVEGLTEALGSGRAVAKAHVVLEFADSAAPKDVVDELVRGRLALKEDESPARVVLTKSGAIVVERSLSTESANWPLYHWFRALAATVLAELHRGWPLAKVRVEAVEHAPFFIPGGD